MRGRPKEGVCLRGHNVSVLGRYPNGTCIACSRERSRVRERTRVRVRPRRPPSQNPYNPRVMVSAQPIKDLLGSPPAAARLWARYRDIDMSTARRAAERMWGKEQVSVDTADRWCIAAGEHLSLVYPSLYQEAS